MGYYTEYLNRKLAGQDMDFQEVTKERKKELKEISRIRGGRDILVMASDIMNRFKEKTAMIEPNDLIYIYDQLQDLSGNALDMIIETPGGSGEVVEDIVRLIRNKYKEHVAMIIPGTAKSAGTILAMSGDEIMMGPLSALGPIDAQIKSPQGWPVSVYAYLEGFNKIKQEVIASKGLNPAYIPILQKITPGDLQECLDAKLFAEMLVTQWLVKYKFKYWEKHSSTGKSVTDDEKQDRAKTIATELTDKSKWLTHGRSINIADLSTMRLKIENFADNPELEEHIIRYYTLLKITLTETTIFKVFETIKTQIYRYQTLESQHTPDFSKANHITMDLNCKSCGTIIKLQFNFQPDIPPQSGRIIIKRGCGSLKCPKCGKIHDLNPIIQHIESQAGKTVQ